MMKQRNIKSNWAIKTLSKEDILNFTSERLTKGDAIGGFKIKWIT